MIDRILDMANKKKTEPKKMEKETKPVKKVAKKEIKNEKVEKVKKQEKLQPELIQGINMKIIVSIFIILLIVLIAFKMYKPKEEEKKQEENKPEVVEKVPLDENQIIAEYGIIAARGEDCGAQIHTRIRLSGGDKQLL